MTSIDVPYGGRDIKITISEEKLHGVLKPRADIVGINSIEDALLRPLGSPSFEDFIGSAKDVIFIVNDYTRPTPTASILAALLDRLPQRVEKSFIVACGTHRAPTPEEYAMILGEKIASDPAHNLLYNDSCNPDSMVCVGKTPGGTSVTINRAVAEASKIVVVTSVEPHYFAGYTGGRKSFLPGVSDYETIERNHSRAMEPEAQTMRLEDNPVHIEMDEFARVAAADKTFSLMTVAGADGGMAHCAAGDLFAVFEDCVNIARRAYAAPTHGKAEVVIAAASPPSDINLYQSQKALENGVMALADGGIIILVSECREGIGSTDFYNMLRCAPTPRGVLERLRGDYKLGFQKAARLALTMSRAEIWALTDMEPGILDAVNIRPVSDLQKAVDEALEKTGGKAVFLPDGTLTVPVMNSTL